MEKSQAKKANEEGFRERLRQIVLEDPANIKDYLSGVLKEDAKVELEKKLMLLMHPGEEQKHKREELSKLLKHELEVIAKLITDLQRTLAEKKLEIKKDAISYDCQLAMALREKWVAKIESSSIPEKLGETSVSFSPTGTDLEADFDNAQKAAVFFESDDKLLAEISKLYCKEIPVLEVVIGKSCKDGKTIVVMKNIDGVAVAVDIWDEKDSIPEMKEKFAGNDWTVKDLTEKWLAQTDVKGRKINTDDYVWISRSGTTIDPQTKWVQLNRERVIVMPKSRQPRPMVNTGTDCFANAVLQVMMRIPQFREKILDVNNGKNGGVWKAVKDIVESKGDVRALREAMGILDGKQYDAHEFLVKMIKRLNAECPGFGDFMSFKVFTDKGDETEYMFLLFDIDVTINNWDSCLRAASKNLIFKSSPDILVVYINRFAKEGNTCCKSNLDINFPLQVIFNDTGYHIIGSITHDGTPTDGHYVAQIDIGPFWYRCNDEHLMVIEPSFNDASILFYAKNA